MEPFTIRCETCKAKLRVRDERVLGQIHECPRCHSMVLIAAPGAVAALEAKTQAVGVAQESVAFPAATVATPTPVAADFALPDPVAASAAAVEAPPIAVPVGAAADWSRIILWAAGGAALFIAGSIVGVITLRGGEKQVVATPELPTVAVADVEVPHAEAEAVATPPEVTVVEPTAPVEVVAAPPVKIEAKTQAEVEPQALVVAAAPQEAPKVVVEESKPERTLTLEPVKPAATMGDIAAQLEAPDYEEIVPEVVAPVEAKTHAVVDAGRVTNVRQQLSLPIAAMEINSLPFSSFIEMVSEMSAVRIVADADTLKAAGVTPRTKVRVAGREETIESLLTAVLDEHHLAWEERDGQIVIVPAR